MKPIAHFVARDRADAQKLLLAKALPLKVKGEIRDRLLSLPDERMLISIGSDYSISIQPYPAVVAPQPEVTIHPAAPVKPRRSKK